MRDLLVLALFGLAAFGAIVPLATRVGPLQDSASPAVQSQCNESWDYRNGETQPHQTCWSWTSWPANIAATNNNP